jgi:hypothetical protein
MRFSLGLCQLVSRSIDVVQTIAIICVCAAGAEWAARRQGFGQPPLALRDPEIGYFLAPDRAYVRFGNTITINRYGFRSEDFDATSARAEDHVLLIGDSVIYGNHHIDQSETVAARLQASLRMQPGGTDAVVSSMATSSWSPVNQLAFYRRFGPFPARQVWVVLSSHDLSAPVERSYDHLPYRTSAPLGAVHDAVLAVGQRARRLLSPPEAETAGTVGHHSTAPSVRALIALLRSHHAEVGLCFHVTAQEMREDHEPAAQAILALIARESGIRLVVTRDAYRAADSANRRVFHDDIHLTAHGARTLADLLERAGSSPSVVR